MNTNCDFDIEPNLQESNRRSINCPPGRKDILHGQRQLCRHEI